VVYFIITDKVPVPALSRLVSDTMEPLAVSAQGRYSPAFLRAIDAALAVRPEQRPQNVAELRVMLGFDTAPQPHVAAPRPPDARSSAGRKALIAAGAGVLLLLAGAGWLMTRRATPLPVRAPAKTLAAIVPAAPAAPPCPLKLADGTPGCPTMVAIPGGSYRIGSVDGEAAAAAEEFGGTAAVIAPFEISAHEVTVGQWQLCVADRACAAASIGAGAAARLPVVNVSWDAAMKYVGWLSQKTKRSYRLPTEAEWEYAARAGQASAFPWGDKVGQDNAHCGQCGSHLDYRQPAPAGSYKAVGGLYDMAGNVYEWVNDCWYPNHAEAAKGAKTPDAACKTKVQKGGAFDSMEADVRPAARTFGERASADPRVGFRVAK
jgi:formylglycine-generating enzyme required for sulfatase activity